MAKNQPKKKTMTREQFLKEMAERYGPKVEIDEEVFKVVVKTLKQERRKVAKRYGKRAKSSTIHQ